MTTRILINALGVAMGGAARHLPLFLPALHEARPEWELHVLTSSAVLDESPGSSYHQHRAAQAGTLGHLWHDFVATNRLVRAIRADLVLNLTNSAPPRPAAPSILYQRNSLYFDPLWVGNQSKAKRSEAALRRRLAYLEIASSARTVVPSNAMGAFLKHWPSWNSQWPITAVHHGVDASHFSFQPRRSTSGSSVSLLNVNLPARHKDFETSIRTISELRRMGIDATLTLTLGATGGARHDQRYVTSLIDLVNSLHIQRYVDFVGRGQDVQTLHSSHDALIFPSRTEAFGFSVLEAMASGLPVIASAIPSTQELLGGLGCYFARGDASGAAHAVLDLLHRTPDRLEQDLRKARTVAEAHSWSANASQIADLIDPLLP